MKHLLVAALVAALLGGALLQTSALDSAGARAQDGTGSSLVLATVAQGVAPMPADPVAWRVVRDTAEPRGAGAFDERALGFALATENPVLQTDEATGQRVLLDPLEATFNHDVVNQRRESLTEAATTYLRIQIVAAADAGDDGEDELVFAGDSFPAPDGDRELSLRLGRLAGDGTLDADGDAPVLLLVLDGEIEVVPATGETTTLRVGEAATFDAALELSQVNPDGPPASFVAAAVGRAVPADADGTAGAEQDETATISFGVAACPEGADFSDKVPGVAGVACVDAAGAPLDEQFLLPDATVVLLNVDTGAELEATTGSDGQASFEGVPPGTYQASVQDTAATRTFCRRLVAAGQEPEDLGYMSPPDSLAVEAGWSVRCVTDVLLTPPDAAITPAPTVDPGAGGTPVATA